MGDMVDLVFMQTHAIDQIDLDFIAGDNTRKQVFATLSNLLGNRQDGRDIVSRMRIANSGVIPPPLRHPEDHYCRLLCPTGRLVGHASLSELCLDKIYSDC